MAYRRINRARKEYECSFCGGKIEVGSHYEKYEWFTPGWWELTRMCNQCIGRAHYKADIRTMINKVEAELGIKHIGG